MDESTCMNDENERRTEREVREEAQKKLNASETQILAENMKASKRDQEVETKAGNNKRKSGDLGMILVGRAEAQLPEMAEEGRQIVLKDDVLNTEEWDEEDLPPLSFFVIDQTKLSQNALCNSGDKKTERKVRWKISYFDSHSDDSGQDEDYIPQNLDYISSDSSNNNYRDIIKILL